jgi:hypothetical protein
MWTTKTTLSSPPFSLSENSTVLPLINISTCTCIYVQTWKRERVQVGVFQDLFVSCKSRESSLELKIIVQLESFFKKKTIGDLICKKQNSDSFSFRLLGMSTFPSCLMGFLFSIFFWLLPHMSIQLDFLFFYIYKEKRNPFPWYITSFYLSNAWSC